MQCDCEVQSVCMSGGCCLWTIMRMWIMQRTLVATAPPRLRFVVLSDTTAPVVTAPADYELMADAVDCSRRHVGVHHRSMPDYSDTAVQWTATRVRRACTFGMKILNGRTQPWQTTTRLRAHVS